MVFDKAWKAAKHPQNAKSGFRNSGLVPLNQANLSYTKILTSSSEARLQMQRREDFQRQFESVGVFRAISAFESSLQESELTLFRNRLTEGYDVQGDKSTIGRLWRAYKAMQNCTSTRVSEEGDADLADIQETVENLSARTDLWPDSFVQFEINQASGDRQEDDHQDAIDVEKSYSEAVHDYFLNQRPYTVSASTPNLETSTGNENHILF